MIEPPTIARIQKMGRVDDRIIDQFMDDVIDGNSTTVEITNIFTTIINQLIASTIIQRRISEDVVIENETVMLQRNTIVDSGVSITLEGDGELLVL